MSTLDAKYLSAVQQIETLKAVIVRQQQDHDRLLVLLVRAYGGFERQLRVSEWDWKGLAQEGRVELQRYTDPVNGDLVWQVEMVEP